MNSVNAQSGMGPQIYAMKKATEVQETAMMKILESAQTQSARLQGASGAKLTGVGSNLDVKA